MWDRSGENLKPGQGSGFCSTLPIADENLNFPKWLLLSSGTKLFQGGGGWFCSEIGRGGSPITECTEMTLVKQVHSLCQGGGLSGSDRVSTIDRRNLALNKN